MGFCTLLQNEYFTLFYNMENIVAVDNSHFLFIAIIQFSCFVYIHFYK